MLGCLLLLLLLGGAGLPLLDSGAARGYVRMLGLTHGMYLFVWGAGEKG